MHIIVTGGSGHIGSALVRGLVMCDQVSRVTVIDNFLTNRQNALAGVLCPSRGTFDLVVRDLADPYFRPDIENLEHVDLVIHLAAITDATSSFERAEYVKNHNLQCTRSALALAERYGSIFVYASSTSVYGKSDGTVLEDDPSCLHPQSPYAESKLDEENLVRSTIPQALILRFGTIFGVSPGIRFHTAVNKFCWQSMVGEPLTVWRDSWRQLRPYLGLNDAVAFLLYVIRNSTNINAGIFNLVSENSTPEEIFSYIHQLVPSVRVNFVDHQIMNQLSYLVSFDKIMKVYGFKPSHRLKDGVEETIKYLSC